MYCNNCSNKVFTDGINIDLVEVRYAKPPLRADGKSKELKNMGRKFKCDKCGMVMTSSQLSYDPPKAEDVKNDVPPDMDEIIARKTKLTAKDIRERR